MMSHNDPSVNADHVKDFNSNSLLDIVHVHSPWGKIVTDWVYNVGNKYKRF